ncbi:hypothetical protein BASA61_009093 [Batrachochytrium salamandrivorans]|nr:hypothetical protein BASA61_009093 [Batrachochytrium salamandrivorans]
MWDPNMIHQVSQTYFLAQMRTSILKLVRQKRVRDSTSGHAQTRITKKDSPDLKELPRDHLNGLALKESSKFPKGYLRKPKRTPQSLSTWYLGSDTDKPKEPQDTQTQEQSNENITTPNVGPEHDSSDSTGAATGSDEATNTNVHQEEESEGSTADRPKPRFTKDLIRDHLNCPALKESSKSQKYLQN